MTVTDIQDGATVLIGDEEVEDVYPFGSKWTVRFRKSYDSERIVEELLQWAADVKSAKLTAPDNYSPKEFKAVYALGYRHAKELLWRQVKRLEGNG